MQGAVYLRPSLFYANGELTGFRPERRGPIDQQRRDCPAKALNPAATASWLGSLTSGSFLVLRRIYAWRRREENQAQHACTDHRTYREDSTARAIWATA